MSYEASIITGDAENIVKLFMTEDKKIMGGRASYTLEKQGSNAVFKVKAEDATALRSALDSIAKALKAYEDMKNV
ncbi:KEOPS complex subunit Pcc1 [Nanoarchaeota archaeon]